LLFQKNLLFKETNKNKGEMDIDTNTHIWRRWGSYLRLVVWEKRTLYGSGHARQAMKPCHFGAHPFVSISISFHQDYFTDRDGAKHFLSTYCKYNTERCKYLQSKQGSQSVEADGIRVPSVKYEHTTLYIKWKKTRISWDVDIWKHFF
jgi:hypothetical protein